MFRMGLRAEITVIEHGKQQTYSTQRGGQSLHLDLLSGASPALRIATAQQPDANWISGLTAGAVIDIDKRMLLWYSNACEEHVLRTAVFETMDITWPDWFIHWAAHRYTDLKQYCAGQWPKCAIIFVRKQGQKGTLYMPAADLADLLEQGPALLQEIPRWPHTNRLATIPRDWVMLDVPCRSATVWTTYGESSSDFPAIFRRWPGWECIEAEGPKREFGPPPGLPQAFESLSKSFDAHQAPHTSSRSGAGTPCTIDLTAAEVANTHAAIKKAMLRNLP